MRVLSTDGWTKGLELIPEEEPPAEEPQELQEVEEPQELQELQEIEEPQELQELQEVVEPRVTLDLIPPEDQPGRAYGEPEQPFDEESPSSSVPSIASILSLPNAAAPQIADASPFMVAGDGYPASGTSPSMVAQALGKAMDEGGQRFSAERRPRSVALFEDPMIEVVAQLEELEPTARGTLTSTPIVHVLVYMLDHRQTGTVVLREVDGRHHVVYFQDGRACVVRNGRPLALLGDGLVASGLMAPDVLVKALEVARRAGSLLGEYLVGSGLVGAEALRLALSAQVPRKLERLVNLAPDTDYAFYAGVNLIPDWARGELFPCHPLSAILAAVRSWHDRARVRATLSRIAKQPLTFHPDLDLSEFILTGEEQAVVEAIHGTSSTLSSLYDLRVAGEDTVSSIVYTFAVTRSFGFTAAKGPPMLAHAPLEELSDSVVEEEVIVAQPSEPPPPPEPPPPAERIPSPTMPVPSSPDGAWRPMKVPAAQVVEPAAVAPRPPRPAEPGPSIKGGPPSVAFRESMVRKAAPRVQSEDDDSDKLVQAMTDFRMAEAAIERNELAQADELARRALAAEPTNPDYGALVAWTSTLSGAKDAIPLAIAKLNVILKDEALCERALLYRGRLYKRAKRTAEALRDFSSVLDVNPKNSEAATEVRLLRMKKK
jgi:hypothetical protein